MKNLPWRLCKTTDHLTPRSSFSLENAKNEVTDAVDGATGYRDLDGTLGIRLLGQGAARRTGHREVVRQGCLRRLDSTACYAMMGEPNRIEGYCELRKLSTHA